MANAKFDITGIGNAIVDTLAQTDDDVLAREGLNKGGMMLVTKARANALYNAMGQTTVISAVRAPTRS